jgi:hypothetical protein
MNENEKLLFKKLMLIIKSFGEKYAEISKYYEDGTLQNWGPDILYAGRHKIDFPGLDEWFTKKFYEIDQSGVLDEHEESGRVDIDFNVESNKITINGYERVYGTDEQFKEYELDDYRIEIFKEYIKRGVSEVICTYEGGGDSGYINDYMGIDGESERIDASIQDVCYTELNNFDGWEINQGSQGNIVFNLKDKTVTINHQWNVEGYKEFPIEVISLA